MLPWVHEHRRKASQRGERGTAESFLDCGSCKARSSVAARSLMHCGFLPRLPNHAGEYPMPDGPAARPSDDTCPGYLIGLPQVGEAARLYPWWDKGQLRDACDGEQPTEALRTAINVLHDAIAACDAERVKPEGGRA